MLPSSALRALGEPAVQRPGVLAPSIDSLDDHTLLAVFGHLDPLPDLFNAAASCRRFRDLALDRRSWLYVTHGADEPSSAAAEVASPAALHRRRSLQAAPSRPSLGTASAAAAADGEDGQPGHWYRSQFATLQAALAASRPGDTILLEAGRGPHFVNHTLAVPHPVHILGGGSEAGECVVVGARGLEAVLDFRASGRLANLTLRATAGACVAHTRGGVTVQGCTLECNARGLPHLAAPLLTRAVSGAQPPATPTAPLDAKQQRQQQQEQQQRQQQRACPAAGSEPASAALPQSRAGLKRPLPVGASAAAGPCELAADGPAAKRRCVSGGPANAAAAGAGVLTVAETRIKARGLAVDLRGTGRLAGVRAIYSPGHALVWLEVDSANVAPPAGAPPSAGSSSSSGAVSAAAPQAADSKPPGTPVPSWLGRPAAAGFDPAAFQRKAQQLAAVLGTAHGGGDTQAQQAAELDQKAEAWCALHHCSLAGTGTAQLPAGQQ